MSSPQPVDIVVVGSCVHDLISYSPRFPRPGESVRGARFAMGFGGKGANQAVAAARLGASVAMVAKVGGDTFGTDTVENFARNGVDNAHVKVVEGASTGTASIVVSAGDGQNAIVLVEGANQLLGADDVDAARALIQGARVLVCQLEVPPATSLRAMKLAKQCGVTTILNPAPGLPHLDAELLQYCDILCPNESETEMLLGASSPPLDTLDGAMEAARRIGPMLGAWPSGRAAVVLTLGSRGCVLLAPAAGVTQPTHVQCEAVDAVDTTGAGDSFVGSLAYYVSRPESGAEPQADERLAQWVANAGAIASQSVTRPGTQSSYHTRMQLPRELFHTL